MKSKEQLKNYKEVVKKYYKEHKTEIAKYKKQWAKENKERLSKYKAEWYINSKKAICIICGKPAPFKYCSMDCRNIGMLGKNNCSWKGGKSFEPYPITWTNQFKKSIRDRDNNKCMRCGRAREEFNRALDVHHIDGIKENTFEENCITLCIPCHNLTKGKEEFFAEGFYNMLKRLYEYEHSEFKLIKGGKE
jgi:5-methylcytosine-specific restriction endonuclease McrA